MWDTDLQLHANDMIRSLMSLQKFIELVYDKKNENLEGSYNYESELKLLSECCEFGNISI